MVLKILRKADVIRLKQVGCGHHAMPMKAKAVTCNQCFDT